MTYKQAVKGSEIDYWEDMERRYKARYEEQVASNNSAAAAATEATLQEIGEKINEINREYREKNKELYRGYRDAETHVGEKMEAMGYTGGLSESGRIALQNRYREGTDSLEGQKSQEVSALRAEGLRSENANRAAAEKANDQAAKEYYGYQLSLSEKRRSELQKEAANMADTGDFSGYKALGYTDEQVSQLRQAWENKNPQLAMRIAAAERRYSAGDVDALSPLLAQYYLAALGYKVKTSGVWDSATESAYRKVFGRKSGRS